jgi:arylsulfatase A-like enzyme
MDRKVFDYELQENGGLPPFQDLPRSSGLALIEMICEMVVAHRVKKPRSRHADRFLDQGKASSGGTPRRLKQSIERVFALLSPHEIGGCHMRLLLAAVIGTLTVPALAQSQPHNVVLFVVDGLRPGTVNENTAPTMAALMTNGVRFTNSHSLFPTFTTANASAMATGHFLGDTGDFSNNIYVGFSVKSAGGRQIAPLENNAVLGELDEHFSGNYLNEETILKLARDVGYSTAALGKLGPTLIFDHTVRTGYPTIIFDDTTGHSGGIPLSEEVTKRLAAADLSVQTPARGENGWAGTHVTPGTKRANIEQQVYFSNVATKVLMPLFKQRNRPFLMVYWSRDPDGTQHNQGDSLNHLKPGINGPSSLAAIRNADDNLAKLLAALKELGLYGTTDVILTSDHGFSTISKESDTSWSSSQRYGDVAEGQMPPGFLAMDLAHALEMNLYDDDENLTPIEPGSHPVHNGAIIGPGPGQPAVIVVGNGGSDLLYLPKTDQALLSKIVSSISRQDYTSGIFVADDLGKIPGTLPLSAIALEGNAITPHPSIVVNFRSFSTGCADPTACGVEVADTVLRQGQGMHGSFSRADTRNTMGALGPGFRKRFEDSAPASNADLGRTIIALMGFKDYDKGKLLGRVLVEAMPDGPMPNVRAGTLRSEPDIWGNITVLVMQSVGETRYLDVAGYPGRTLGLPAEIKP